MGTGSPLQPDLRDPGRSSRRVLPSGDFVAGNAARKEVKGSYMKKTRRKKAPSAESIAQLADEGKDISRYFTNRGGIRQPIQRVNLDLTADMLQELDQAASALNVSRQAVIKVFIRQALDQHHLAQRARRAA